MTAPVRTVGIGASAGGLNAITRLLAATPADIGFAYVGIKQGYFKEEGLDVTVEIGRGGSDAVARVAAGADDFGAASLSSLMNATSGLSGMTHPRANAVTLVGASSSQ